MKPDSLSLPQVSTPDRKDNGRQDYIPQHMQEKIVVGFRYPSLFPAPTTHSAA
jgi:hypothetical protein